MVDYTERRGGRESALFFGLQSALGSIVDDFTAAGAGRVWSTRLDMEPSLKLLPIPEEAMSRLGGLTVDHDTGEGPEGAFDAHASPETVEIFLRNAWGSFAAGAFTRANQVKEFLTLAWVEDRFSAGASVKRLVRIRDVVIHELSIMVESAGMVSLVAMYAGTFRSNRKLDALGGVVLPAAPMQTQDRNLFEGRTAVLTRDPGGDNETMSFESARLVIDRNFEPFYSMSNGPVVMFHGGEVRLEVETQVADEAWNFIDKTEAQVEQDWRLTVSAPSPAKVLTLDLRDVLFRPGAIGHDGQDQLDQLPTGFPKVTASGAYLDITLA